MRSLLFVLLFFVPFTQNATAQELLHYWNFNNAEGAPPFASPHPADQTIGGGELTYSFAPNFVMSFNGSTLNAQPGDGAGGSLSIQGGEGEINNGEHFDLHIPTAGYTQIAVTYAMRRTSTGFDRRIVSYSVDGGSEFQHLLTIDSNQADWWLEEIDLGGVVGAEDNQNLVLRIALDGATSMNGNNRFDNITVTGYADGSNRPPAFTSTLQDQSIDAGELFTFQYEAEDIDGDQVAFALEEGPAGATIDATSGLFTWTPILDQGDEAHEVVVEATDGDLTTSTSATLYVVAYPDNHAPVFEAALPDTLLQVGDELRFTYVVSDADGDDITLEMTEAPEGASFDGDSGEFSWTVTSPGSYRVAFVLDDGKATVETDAVVGVRGLIFGGLEGAELRQKLREAYSPDQVFDYNTARDSMYAILHRGDDGFVRGVYTGFAVALPEGDPIRPTMTTGGIDAEHTWPQSKGAGTGNGHSDLHHLFPAKSNVNSARGNMPFGEVAPENTRNWYRGTLRLDSTPSDDITTYSREGAQRFQPRDAHAGAAARASLYFYSIYESVADDAFFVEQMNVFDDWNETFAPTPAEVRRSYLISQWQGNDNPFVFDPTLSARVKVDLEEPELMPIGDALQLPDGTVVVTEGIVTRARGRYLRFQDTSGAMTVFQSQGSLYSAIERGDVAEGDHIRMRGTMDTFSEARQIGSVAEFEVLSRENVLPEPVVLTFEQIDEDGESYASMLVRIDGLQIVTDGNATFSESTTYQLKDREGEQRDLNLRVQRSTDSDLVGEPIPEGTLTFTGILAKFFDGFQIEGINRTDFQPYVGSDAPTMHELSFRVSPAYPNPVTTTARVDIVSETTDNVRAELYDALGRRVAVLHDAPIAPGVVHSISFDGRDVPSGIYFVHVTDGMNVDQQSVVVIK